MLEDFVLINPDKRQVYQYSGPIDLFRGSYSKLGDLLTRPDSIKPLDIKHILELYRPMHIKRLTAGYRAIQQGEADEGEPEPLSTSTSSPCNSLGDFSKLPVELLVMIFDYLDSYETVICFSMTTLALFCLGYDCIQKRYREDLWAGDRLICLDDTDLGDFPETFSDEEISAVLAIEGEEDALKAWATAYIPSEPYFNKLPDSLGFDYDHDPNPHLMYALINKVLNRSHGHFDRDPNDWLLFNLTKCEYISRSTIIDLLDIDKRSRLTYGEILVIRICWSTMGRMYRDGTYRGDWAGDRIEITTMDRLKDRAKWIDISEQVAEHIKTIWKAQYGERWKEEMKERPVKNLAYSS
ncbi:hypothetical protein QCA50_008184 [Cerrena zonata]|uniref:F-box domain-containing protein n=1 Tax=Cerrena zonata TaxID=2478898 RepID=A0AAW0G7A7_9APHY